MSCSYCVLIDVTALGTRKREGLRRAAHLKSSLLIRATSMKGGKNIPTLVKRGKGDESVQAGQISWEMPQRIMLGLFLIGKKKKSGKSLRGWPGRGQL